MATYRTLKNGKVLTKPASSDKARISDINTNTDNIADSLDMLYDKDTAVNNWSVNGAKFSETAAVVLDAEDVGAVPSETLSGVTSIVYSTTEPVTPVTGMLWIHPAGE